MEDSVWDLRMFMHKASDDNLYEAEMILREIGYDDEADLLEKIAQDIDAISDAIKEKYYSELPD